MTSIKGILFALELARRTGAKVLHASTSEIYGDPLAHPQEERYWGNVNTIGIRSCYDEGKRVAETLCADYIREHGVDVRMVRIFNTYGPRMHPEDGRVISNFIMQALRGEDITVFGDGSQTRSFQYCDDLINAFRAYMELPLPRVREFFAAKGLGAPVLYTGNPGEYTIRELAEEVLRQLPRSESRIIEKPLPDDDPKRRKPDIALAKELLGWEPRIPLREGLARTIEYFRAVQKPCGL
jgi:UDP-glucuronate decarboxylase